MNVFRSVVFVAALAGLVAGVLMAAMQSFATVPLILQAEAYEIVGVHDHATPAEAAAPHAHEDGEKSWAPSDGVERFAFSVAFNIVSGIGFALLLVAVSEFAGGIATWRQGLRWGFAGFAVFTLAPGLSLPPELPAMPTADLTARQIWWTATVLATATGLALIAFRGAIVPSIVGLALIVAPHWIGAPQPLSHETAVPDNLHHQFVVATTITSLIFWVALGGLVGVLRNRFAPSPDGLQTRLA